MELHISPSFGRHNFSSCCHSFYYILARAELKSVEGTTYVIILGDGEHFNLKWTRNILFGFYGLDVKPMSFLY